MFYNWCVPTQILATKLYIPSPRLTIVRRPRLIERLNQGLWQAQGSGSKLTLISAPAGFGKTTLVSDWVERLKLNVGSAPASQTGLQPANLQPPRQSLGPTRIAWLSLDEADNDRIHFLIYLIAALRTIDANIAKGALSALQSPQPPSIESILTSLINEIAGFPAKIVLILDDYHVIGAKPAGASTSVDEALTFLLEHLPPQMHLVIATREDPNLSLARLRARGQLSELRAADLRFTPAESAEFLNQAMGLSLSAEDIAALESRTEGWIAGLQLAALALQGLADQKLAGQGPAGQGPAPQGTIPRPEQKGAADFIQSFTGSHRFVMDYLVEEVLRQQPESVQAFLLRTSILERLCAPLCEAVVGPLEGWNVALFSPRDRENPWPSAAQPSKELAFKHSGEILEYLERANLFVIPLDNERRWYRYHHLFADLLRQRMQQQHPETVVEYHLRASQWFEENGLEFEAFRHAAAANDIERAERLIAGGGIPMHLSGLVTAILDWLGSLPASELNARPTLWWRYASLMLVNGQTTGVEEKLLAAEAALQTLKPGVEPDDETRTLFGRIAAARAVLALTRYQPEIMLAQSRRALEYLPAGYLSLRANAYWTLGYAYYFQGDRSAARQALTEAISLSQASGDIFTTLLATIGMGNVLETENDLHAAAETYRRVLKMAGDQPLQIIYEVHLGLARILYEWNDLQAAQVHGEQSLKLARQYDRVIDRYIICEVFLAHLKLAQGDLAEAAAILARAEQSARQRNFVFRIPEVAAEQVLVLLRQGNLAEAAALAQTYELPLSQARVSLAQGDAPAALATLDLLLRQVQARGWQDERLKALALQAVALQAAALQSAALQAKGEKERAMQALAEALRLAEPGGFIRLFVDEGPRMAQLLAEAAQQGVMPDYTGKLLAAFEAERRKSEDQSHLAASGALAAQSLIEPLSQRELEVLRLIAQGLSNHEISERLYLALDTVKGHNRKIYGKLQVQSRTEAVERALELGLL